MRVFGRPGEFRSAARGKSGSACRRMARGHGPQYGRRMRRRVESFLRNPRVQGAGDALLALVLAVTSVVPVLHGDPSWGRPKLLGVALALLSTVPVAWRARWPLSAASRSCSPPTARVSTRPPRIRRRSSRSSRSCSPRTRPAAAPRDGGRCGCRRSLPSAAIPVFVAASRTARTPVMRSLPYVWLLAAWAAGRTARSWRRKSVALERPTASSTRAAGAAGAGRGGGRARPDRARAARRDRAQRLDDGGPGRGGGAGARRRAAARAERARGDRGHRPGDRRRDAHAARRAPVRRRARLPSSRSRAWPIWSSWSAGSARRGCRLRSGSRVRRARCRRRSTCPRSGSCRRP